MSSACPDIVELEQYLSGESDQTTTASLAAHLAECPECSELLADLRENLKLASSLRRDLLIGEELAPQAVPEAIGPYRILRKLGQGGMGSVFVAEQENPRRTVALKIIRPGLLSPALLARFRHEAQVLGRLQHPGIAQIYEAASHPSARGSQPYFVMELVNGPPLLDFAEQRRLDVAARLELLAKICDAVQHAHSKGVIHRDLKPDNILIDDSATAPQPKILDFGVARVIDPDQQTTTLYTSAGQIVGTVAYMSPEQAAGQSAEIDTRSDVYALGVIGYQLLSGKLPYKLSMASIAESVRTIMQDDPTPLHSIVRSLRGDVTTIIGKALSKEKSRRYPSAAEMAADIRRHLRDEPISAHPPSTIYQLGKFARRNKGLVAGIAAAFVVLVAGVIGTSVGLVRAQRERDAAQAARRAADASANDARTEALRQTAVNRFLQELLAAANPRRATAVDKARGKDVTVLEAVNEAAAKVDAGALKDQPVIELAVRLTMGGTYAELGELAAAERHTIRALELARHHFGPESADVANSLSTLARVHGMQGRFADAVPRAEQAVAIMRKLHPQGHADLAMAIGAYATTLQQAGKLREAEPVFRESLDMRLRFLGDAHMDTATAWNNLAMCLDEQGKLADAEPMYLRSLQIKRTLLGDEHPDTATTLNNLAFVYRNQGKMPEAEKAFRDSLAIRRKVFGDESSVVAVAINNLGSLLQAVKRYDEAEPLYLQAIAIQRKLLGDNHPSLASSINNLATLYRERGMFRESEPLFRESLEIRRHALGEQHPAVAVGMANLASVLREIGKADEAAQLASQAVQITLATRGPDSPEVAAHRSHLALCLMALSRFDEGERELLEAWRILQPRLSTGDLRAVNCVRNLRKFYIAWNKPDKAAEFEKLIPATMPTTRPFPITAGSFAS